MSYKTYDSPLYKPVCIEIRNTSFKSRDILDAVMARNKSHAVSLKMGRATRIYKRASGLLQGDPLSTALCDIYLGDLVRAKIRSVLGFVSREKRLLVRAVDDFLFVSLCREEVRSFLQLMSSGFEVMSEPDNNDVTTFLWYSKIVSCILKSRSDEVLFQSHKEYGCMVKSEKTRTNAVDGREMDEVIPFCGALICPRTQETRPDFRSYFGRNIAFASKLNTRDGETLQDFLEKRLNFLVTVNLDRLYQGPHSIHKH